MSYSIKWTPLALNELENLPGDITERIINKVENLKDDPFHYLEHYHKILEKNFEIISKFQRNFTITRVRRFINYELAITGR